VGQVMAEDYQIAAVNATKSGDYKNAIDLWEKRLVQEPNNKKAVSNLGSLYFRLKLFDKAAEYLKKATDLDDKNSILQVLLANSYIQISDYSNAKVVFKKVIEQDTKNIPARIGLARLYIKQNQVDLAIATLKIALKVKKNDAQVHWQLAQIYRALDQNEKSDKHLKHILELRSESPLVKQAHQILSDSYAKEKGVDPTKLQSLRAENLVKIYGKRQVVRQVSIEVREGEIVGLLGPNGAGKTTTFYQITGMVRPNSGKIFLNKINITKMPMYKRARLGVGYLSQEPSIFRKLTVEDNILSILQTLKLSKLEREQKLNTLLEEFSITHIRKSKAYNLSGGERRRVEISRALVLDPKFLLLDEPFAGIDPIAVEDIQKIIHKLRDKGIGILITDHNVHETLAITDRAYLLYDGRVLKSGTAEFLANDEEAKTLYLGDKFRLDR
jgi:lipopolysaccharide export system ATP-binding protein